MNRKVMAVAVAAAFAAPAALAQTTVQIGGTINILYDSVRAGGNTGGDTAVAGNNSLKSHDRVRDGAGSNIRFFVGEDLGGGNQAFIQVESAVIVNSDTRNNALGAGSNTATGASVWGNRNSAIGVRSKSMGRFLIGVWDVHYDEMYGVDPGWLTINSAASTLGLMNNFGAGTNISPTIGARYGNVLRWDSPNWSGFSMSLARARPTDGPPVNTATADAREGKKNRAWHVALRYETGGLQVRYSYLNDKDINVASTISFAGNNFIPAAGGGAFGVAAGATVSATVKVTSNRIGARYRFANGFGIGLLWDSSKTSSNTIGATVANASSDLKRRVWAIPLTFDTGNHSFMGTYQKATDFRGSIGGVNVGTVTNPVINATVAGTLNFGSETGAKQVMLGYAYKLSQRTNVGLSYTKITNDALVRYDTFANSTGNTAVGGDPRMFAFNVRHTF